MGALKGSIAVRRYQVTEALPQKDVRGKLSRGVRAHIFAPIDPRSPEVRTHGWVSLHDGDDLDLTAGKIFWIGNDGEQLRLTMRVDTLKPSTNDVRRIVEAEAAKKSEAEGRPISRGEKRAMREEAVRKLRLSTPPRTKLIDVVWDLDRGRLFLFSQVRGTTELFVDLFARSFAVGIEEEGASRLARKALGDKLDKLEPTAELHQGFASLRPLPAVLVEDDADDVAKKKSSTVDEYGFDKV